ncbi:MAG TPA: thiamine pyrophosphate-dependent enzyme [Chloroflexota bacterium]|nr:thiamine pyrophosphate-dependent enzyme [Chloroflexota bacterium]
MAEKKETAADRLVETMLDWGIDTVFGIPGDGINGIMESLRTRQDRVRFIQVRHEEAAALACVGYAKFTGKMAACVATSGPGGIHLLNGLYDAKMDGQPVLAIAGTTYHDLVGTMYQQDVNLDVVFKDVAVYSERVMGPAHVENVVDLACRKALAYRGVSFLLVPVDVQEQEVPKGSKKNLPHHTSDVMARSGGTPAERDLQRAAEVLNAGKKVVILAGRGAVGAGGELEQTAETLGAVIVKPLLGKGCVADESPYTTGGAGLLGTRPSEEALKGCDTLLMVGTSFPYMDHLPKPDQARGVQIEMDPARVGLRFPVEVGLVGDSRATLQKLLPLLRRNDDRSFLEKAQAGMKEWWQLLEHRATRTDLPLKPQAVAYHLDPLLADDAICITDSGTITTWWARYLKMRGRQQYSCSGTLATMACALPYSIGAQIAHPGRQVVAMIGDGGFSMLMADFATLVKYQLPVKIVVFKNGTLGQIKWEQLVFLGNPEYGCELHPIDFVKVAEACGGQGFRVEDPKDVPATLRAWLDAPGPALLEAVVDPYEPPWPPMITVDQAEKMALALAKGTPSRERIALTAFRDRIEDFSVTAPGPLRAIADKVADLLDGGHGSGGTGGGAPRRD